MSAAAAPQRRCSLMVYCIHLHVGLRRWRRVVAVLTAEELDNKLAEIVRRLRTVFAPVAVYLFGSYAYGKPHSGSDIDLLVVVEDSPFDAYSRDALAYRAVGAVGVSKDVQVYTRAEFEQRAALPVSFERTVKQKGKLIYAP